ncbi:hypothetical protein FZC84_17305 [Rossellomorea vietnamensis]|uniref:Uncharacterized protein n=1 Tax=Rossellomorea vietnamensis TaxID=218284 RepID=A0A5D4M8L7_9BACI|nr:hypothetical protein [Rossellomorea vietnamensis]TYR97956.1 hypothetical protein FZC84_17305 [Rossellomorea vietnamensis]
MPSEVRSDSMESPKKKIHAVRRENRQHGIPQKENRCRPNLVQTASTPQKRKSMQEDKQSPAWIPK